MNRIHLFSAIALASLASCSSTSKAVGVHRVDDLLGRVERVHLDAELCQLHAHQSVEALRVLVMGEYETTAAEAFVELERNVAEFRFQSQRLQGDISPMNRSAVVVFERWMQDMDQFSSQHLRDRSRKRLAETRELYTQVLLDHAPAQAELDHFALLLDDHMLYLSNDLSASAVASLADAIDLLRAELDDVDVAVDSLKGAAAEYVNTTAPIGQVRPAPGQTLPAQESETSDEFESVESTDDEQS